MALRTNLRRRLEKLLSTVDDQGAGGPRLGGDALRLWNRIGKFASMNLIAAEYDSEAMELACYALQLPARQAGGVVGGKLGRMNLRERCEEAAELLVSLLSDDVEEALLDRAARLLQEVPHRTPKLDEAKLLADALNLDDFGITGLFVQSIQMALHGEGITELVVGAQKREDYGYWQARLKDGFHFEPIRAMARKRLESARQVVKMLSSEIEQDRP
jgi:hypothetical protein